MHVKRTSIICFIGFFILAIAATSCTPTLEEEDTASIEESSSSDTTQTEVTPASGPMAAKIIFKQANPAGSFNEPSSSGTVAAPGSGHRAIRIFNADGSLLAEEEDEDDEDTNWPEWLESVEIGISGGNNTSATDTNCARFGDGSEGSDDGCDFGSGDFTTSECHGPDGYYRVSEYDCAQGTITDGNGGPDDGVYIRAVFNRDTEYLAAHENILVSLEYAASVVNPAPSDPTNCFTAGVFSPTSTDCSDMSWNIYMKHEKDDIVNPFMLLVPPAFAYISGDAATPLGGSGIGTKQFILPLAGDSSITTLQISRIQALSSIPSNCTINSPYCLGMVFFSLTFYRM